MAEIGTLKVKLFRGCPWVLPTAHPFHTQGRAMQHSVVTPVPIHWILSTYYGLLVWIVTASAFHSVTGFACFLSLTQEERRQQEWKQQEFRARARTASVSSKSNRSFEQEQKQQEFRARAKTARAKAARVSSKSKSSKRFEQEWKQQEFWARARLKKVRVKTSKRHYYNINIHFKL